MPLDSADSTSIASASRSGANPSSGLDLSPESFKPILQRPVGDTRFSVEVDGGLYPTSLEARASIDLGDPGRLSDGVRILGRIPADERSRLYHQEISSRLEVLQSWEGVVSHVHDKDKEFTARLYDLTETKADVSEAVFDIADVSANDRDLLKIGGVFRWMIGYRKHSFGQQERVSALVFRRLPTWYAGDLDDALKYGEGLAGTISIDRGVSASPSER